MKEPVFISAGEALTDLIVADGARTQWTARTGGSTWNVARAMAKLGVPTAFAGAISRDVFGDALWEASMDSGLDARFLQRVEKSPLLAIVHRLAPPTYFFVGDDSADLHFDPQALPGQWRTHCRWMHFGGISLARQPLAGRLVELAREAKRAGIRISYDPNWRLLMDERYDPTLRAMTELADVVKVSDEDLAGLFRTGDIEGAFATLRGFNPPAQYLYTRGEHGASLHVGETAWHTPAFVVPVADTVGAGDASIAGFAYSQLAWPERAPGEHLRFAAAAGAAACIGAGATPPALSDIEDLVLEANAA